MLCFIWLHVKTRNAKNATANCVFIYCVHGLFIFIFFGSIFKVCICVGSWGAKFMDVNRCVLVLHQDWHHHNRWEEAQAELLSDREDATMWEYCINSLVKTIQSNKAMYKNKSKKSNTDTTNTHTSLRRHPASETTVENWIAYIDCRLVCKCVCVWVSSHLRVRPQGMTLMLHTHCFAKLMDLLECLQWAWKRVQL